MTTLLRRLPSLLVLLLLVPAPRADELAERLTAFRKALRGGDLVAREAALAGVVSTGDLEVHQPLLDEIGRASVALRDARDDARRAHAAVERKQRLVRDLELRVENDPSLEDSLQRQRSELGDLQRERSDAERVLRLEEPWLASLRLGVREFAAALGDKDGKRWRKQLWKALEDEEGHRERVGLFELVGESGDEDATENLLALLAKTEAERLRAKRKLAKSDKAVRKLERELQEDAGADPSAVAAKQQQYRREVKDLTDVRRAVTLLAFQMDAASEAGARNLARLAGEPARASIAAVTKAASKTEGALRRKLLALLARSDGEGVVEALVASLGETEADDVEARRALLAGLARPELPVDAFDAVAAHLASEHWQVRAAAVEALVATRRRDAIPLLIDRLAVEEGRLRSDLSDALTSLTAKSFRSNFAAWNRWWQAEGGDAFVVPPADAEPEGSLSLEEELGVTFFGIRTESQRVLFVLDVSGSMDFSMVPRDNPTDDPRKPYDYPQGNEQSRLAIARNQLVTALGGIRDGGLFNLVLYASDVWTWEDELVTMDRDVRSDVLRFVDALEAEGATNVYGAIMRAFDLAGVREDAEWSEPSVDTIFVLSDGRPSIGVLTEPADILAAVRERNEAAGIVIHTIGLSGAQDAAFLQLLAEENGGSYAGK